MVVIRLARFGTKHLPRYRVTIADQKYAATGRHIEVVGHFNPKPLGKDPGLVLEMDKINAWIKKGAQPTERVRTLLRKYEKSAVAKA
jgi:small subunit ribosomal protein S16